MPAIRPFSFFIEQTFLMTGSSQELCDGVRRHMLG
jgi:hypothetical protein